MGPGSAEFFNDFISEVIHGRADPTSNAEFFLSPARDCL